MNSIHKDEQSISSQKEVISREQANVLKALAILTVLIAHGNGFSQSFVNVPIIKDGRITSIFCQGGMCIFLILSGYGLLSSFLSKGFISFWENKFTKIFMPALFVQCSWFVLWNFAKFVFLKKVSINWETVFGDLICTNANNGIDGSIWYLSYLLFCYISFYLIFCLLKNSNYSEPPLFKDEIWMT